MKIEQLGSPRDFAERVAANFGLPAPDLIALVDAAFYASLHEEEARRLEFNIAWVPTDRECTSVVAITPVLATPKNLAKLAPATRHDTTTIAVRRDGEQLVAWALLAHGTPASHPLTIRVLGAGVLRIDLAGEPRALYGRGEAYLMSDDVKSPSKLLTSAFVPWNGSEIDPRAAIVTRIAERTLAHHHGGMILVIPADAPAPVGVRVHYAVGDGADLLSRRYLTGDAAQIDAAIEVVARLTGVDNALLVDTDLRVRGFGVQVLEGDAPQMTFEHLDPYSSESHFDDLATFKGTRHPAGVIFCLRQHCEAAAIIASQDGHLSLAIKNARGGVEVIGSYERAFGWR